MEKCPCCGAASASAGTVASRLQSALCAIQLDHYRKSVGSRKDASEALHKAIVAVVAYRDDDKRQQRCPVTGQDTKAPCLRCSGRGFAAGKSSDDRLWIARCPACGMFASHEEARQCALDHLLKMDGI